MNRREHHRAVRGNTLVHILLRVCQHGTRKLKAHESPQATLATTETERQRRDGAARGRLLQHGPVLTDLQQRLRPFNVGDRPAKVSI